MRLILVEPLNFFFRASLENSGSTLYMSSGGLTPQPTWYVPSLSGFTQWTDELACTPGTAAGELCRALEDVGEISAAAAAGATAFVWAKRKNESANPATI
jgi:hypothetical protein